MNNVVKLLKDTRKLLSSEDKWTTGAYWRNAKGEASDDRADATCYCAVGALDHCYALGDYKWLDSYDAGGYLRIAAKDLFDEESLIDVNDNRPVPRAQKYMNVLLAYEYAIDLAKANANKPAGFGSATNADIEY